MKCIDRLREVEETFLLSRGWEKHGADKWLEPLVPPLEPGDHRRFLRFGHAVNSEKHHRGGTSELRAAEERYLLASGWQRSERLSDHWHDYFDGKERRRVFSHQRAVNRQKFLDHSYGGKYAAIEQETARD